MNKVKGSLQQAGRWIKGKLKQIAPGKYAVKGAAIGLMVLTGFVYLINATILAIQSKDPWVLLPGVAFALLALAGAWLVHWVIGLLGKIPRFNTIALLWSAPLLMVTFMFDPVLTAIFLVMASLIGAAMLVVRKTGFRALSRAKRAMWVAGSGIGLAGLGAGFYLYVQKGFEMDPFINAANLKAGDIAQLPGASPAEKGAFSVNMLTYGSGKDKHRPEFGAKVTLKTKPVNGTAFLDNWSGFAGRWRTRYWGFDARSLPVNARVWYPKGNGPFPLVLVVHGNHGMTDFSDPGYDYLGELLASRGMIVASVDENFLNGNWSDITGGLEKENDARGWMLLEHLKVWHEWNLTPGHSFYQKIDTGKIALIGHSRGGEAVAHAALFNSLDYYPDDASVGLHYHYNIKGIVAIAPVDGQYQPGETPPRLKDLDYFTLHGSQDGDVTSFMGSMQFERIAFTGNDYHFKAGLYVYGANHGQFNTSWGDNDFSHPFTGLLNRAQMLPAAKQQEIAKLYISAFLEASLSGKREYLPLFADARKGRKWLPETVYLNQFEDANTRYLTAYDEDFDVSSGLKDGIAISGKNLTVWREQEIGLKHGKKGSRAVFLGWHYDSEKKDTGTRKMKSPDIPDSIAACYTIEFNENNAIPDTASALVFSLAEAKEESNPKAKGKWIEGKEKDADNKGQAKSGKKNPPKENQNKKEDGEGTKNSLPKAPEPIDFTIELTDANGERVRFPLSRFSLLQRELEVRIKKMDFLGGDKSSEKVFQKFIFPLSERHLNNPAFSIQQLRRIRFVFNRSECGVVVMDNLGFMKRLD